MLVCELPADVVCLPYVHSSCMLLYDLLCTISCPVVLCAPLTLLIPLSHLQCGL